MSEAGRPEPPVPDDVPDDVPDVRVPPELGSLWKAVLIALVIVAGGLCVAYGLWLGLFLLLTSGLTGTYGANK
jgi:hypothetical protein